MTSTHAFAEFFSVPARRPAPQYLVTWPCGATWTFSRDDLEVPIYHNGEQTGVDIIADGVREMIGQLQAEGARIARAS